MAKAIILEDSNKKVRSIKTSNFFKSKIVFKSKNVKINEVLPFRVKITNIGVPSYSSNAAPIGIAVIGYSNYIL